MDVSDEYNFYKLAEWLDHLVEHNLLARARSFSASLRAVLEDRSAREKAAILDVSGAEDIRHALGLASELEVLGMNREHAEGCPGQVDEAGVTAREYRRNAQRIRALLNRRRRQIKAAIEASPAGRAAGG